MSRNGEALPGRPRIQADPGTQKEIGRRTPKFGASGAVIHTPAGVFYEPKKTRRQSPTTPCQFGSLTSGGNKILGGFVTCGDQNWTIPDKDIPEEDGIYDAYIEVSLIANRDDDNSLLLPGIETGTEPGSGIEFVESGSLPANTSPSLPTGAGVVILPVATLEVSNGRVTSFTPGGCGPFIVEHCGGSLSYSRPGE